MSRQTEGLEDELLVRVAEHLIELTGLVASMLKPRPALHVVRPDDPAPVK